MFGAELDIHHCYIADPAGPQLIPDYWLHKKKRINYCKVKNEKPNLVKLCSKVPLRASLKTGHTHCLLKLLSSQRVSVYAWLLPEGHSVVRLSHIVNSSFIDSKHIYKKCIVCEALYVLYIYKKD